MGWRPFTTKFLASIAASIAFVPTTHAADASGLGCSQATPANIVIGPAWTAAIVDEVNAHRASLGRPAVQVDTGLTASAVWKANDMAARAYADHDDPGTAGGPGRTVEDRALTCGFRAAAFVSENLLSNDAATITSARAAVDSWLGSPGHRANLEDRRWRWTGVGGAHTAADQGQGVLLAQLFSDKHSSESTTCAALRVTVRAGTRLDLAPRLCGAGAVAIVGSQPAGGRVTGTTFVTPRRAGFYRFTFGWSDVLQRQPVVVVVRPVPSRSVLRSATCTRARLCTVRYSLTRPVVPTAKATLIVQARDPMRGWFRLRAIALPTRGSSTSLRLPAGEYNLAITIAPHPLQGGSSSSFLPLRVR